MPSASDLEVSYNTCTGVHWLVSTLPRPDAPEVTARVNPPGPVVKGSIGSLVCDVIAGDLPISYSWVSSRGEGLSSDSESGSITVPFCAYEDYGIYTCTATNPFGSHASIVEVIPAGIENMPGY